MAKAWKINSCWECTEFDYWQRKPFDVFVGYCNRSKEWMQAEFVKPWPENRIMCGCPLPDWKE